MCDIKHCGHHHLCAIDLHAHWFPRPFLDLLKHHGLANGVEFAETDQEVRFSIKGTKMEGIGKRFVDLDERIAVMDEQGVAIQALSLTRPMTYWAGREFSHRLNVAYNDAVALAHETYPDRFYGLASLPMHEPDLALQELQRAARLPGIRGAYMATHILDKELSDPVFFPVYEALAALKLPMYLHPVEVIGPDRLKHYFLRNLLGNPFETAIAGAHLIFGGVLDRFPDLEVVLPHAGGALPWLAGRLTRGWETSADVPRIARPPVQYLRRFWYDTIGYSDEVLEHLVRHIGQDRIVMGSDYCFPIAYDQPVKNVLDNPLISDDSKQDILTRNASKLLQLA